MYYFDALTLPAYTLEDAALILTIPLDNGVIDFLEVEYPAGCAGLVYAKVTYNTIQIIPYNPGGWLRGDNRIFKASIDYEVKDPPYEIKLWGYNLDDTYPHTISMGINFIHGVRAVDISKLLEV